MSQSKLLSDFLHLQITVILVGLMTLLLISAVYMPLSFTVTFEIVSAPVEVLTSHRPKNITVT